MDLGGGRYRAKLSTANEQLFWTGSRGIVPRRVTLWLEPVITFAAMARLRYEFNWPAELIASQPRSWAFDLAAHSAEDAACYRVLGEVKKTVREARALEDALRWLSEGQEETKFSKNAVRKWKALLHDRPPVVWIVGPEGHSVVYSVEYHPSGGATLILDTEERLLF